MALSNKHRSASYLRYLAASLIVTLTGAVALVVLIDPYRLYRLIEIEGVNSVKPRPTRYQNEIKVSHAIRLRPSALIVGNSRAEIGFDPLAPAFSGRGLSAFNLAIPGSGIATARSQLEYLDQHGLRPKLIVIGVEFLDFIDMRRESLAAAHAKPAQGTHPVEGYFWRFDSLLSLTSIGDALRTLPLQYASDPESTSARGFNPLMEYRAIARREGYERLFRQRAQENARVFLKKSQGTPSLDDYAHLEAVVENAARSDLELALVIYPYHAQILALFEASGLWPTFEAWKQKIVSVVETAGQRFPNSRIALYDFSGYAEYQCEKIPAAGDLKSVTQWYWEGGHFKNTLGDLVLDRVLSSQALMPDNSHAVFGYRLSADSLVGNALRIAQERQRCLQSSPEMFSNALAVVGSLLKANPGVAGESSRPH
ncbi:MAG: hypothetical protein H6R13_1401 [Proteobacteria bacterium]|nr:hypothetical protein [Pseudomonadota bacterium]